MTSHKLRSSSKKMRHTPADAPAAPHLFCGVAIGMRNSALVTGGLQGEF